MLELELVNPSQLRYEMQHSTFANLNCSCCDAILTTKQLLNLLSQLSITYPKSHNTEQIKHYRNDLNSNRNHIP